MSDVLMFLSAMFHLHVHMYIVYELILCNVEFATTSTYFHCGSLLVVPIH